MLASPLRNYTEKDRVDVIVTNPPFGGMEEEGVPNNFPASFRTKETADLFLVLIMHLLKHGGRCAVVLPDGTLFGEGIKTRIKEKLLEECNLHTIVRLPNGVFAPYTNIKTNILFFEKGFQTKEVWFFEHPLPNHRNGKAYTKTDSIQYDEFKIVKDWWNNRKENEYAWKIKIDKIKKANYNLDFRNPGFNSKIRILTPSTIMERMIYDYNETNNVLKLLLKDLKTYQMLFNQRQNETSMI